MSKPLFSASDRMATLRAGLENIDGDLYLYGVAQMTAEQALASISETTSDLWVIVGREPTLESS